MSRSLQQEITDRLWSAGIDRDDPGLRQWAQHNRALGIDPEREGSRNQEKEAEAAA